MPPSPNRASSEMMVARCSDGMRALSQPCLTGMYTPKAAVDTRYSGTATQNCCTRAAPTTAAFGVYMPVKQGWLNARIPSEQRATIISLDALFGDGGMTVGQVGLGYLSQVVSIPAAWLVGGLAQAAALPLLSRARRAERAEPAERAAETASDEHA